MKNWAFKLQNMLLITLINGITERNLKGWLIRFWDITPTLIQNTEIIRMMMGLYKQVEVVIGKALRQLETNVVILLI